MLAFVDIADDSLWLLFRLSCSCCTLAATLRRPGRSVKLMCWPPEKVDVFTRKWLLRQENKSNICTTWKIPFPWLPQNAPYYPLRSLNVSPEISMFCGILWISHLWDAAATASAAFKHILGSALKAINIHGLSWYFGGTCLMVRLRHQSILFAMGLGAWICRGYTHAVSSDCII